MDSDGREAAPPEMLTFLETTSGASWLAGILLGKDCIGLRYVNASSVQLAQSASVLQSKMSGTWPSKDWGLLAGHRQQLFGLFGPAC